MCRFSATLAPPPAPADGLDTLLDDDDFNWFDAIDEELPEELLTANLAPVMPQLAPAVPESDSSAGCTPARADVDTMPSISGNKSAGSAGCSDTSSYDLVEMFKQQVESQQPAVQAVMPTPAAQSSSFPQFVAAPFAAAAMQQQLMCGMPAAPFAGACVAPQLLAPMGAGPTSFLPLAAAAAAAGPAGLNNTVGNNGPAAVKVEMTASATASGSTPTCSRRGGGSRGTKTQEEIEAAVERIKQKRRESAQRSRARKNDYMRQLELENQALKDEVQRLQQLLGAVQRNTFQQQQAAALVQLGAM